MANLRYANFTFMQSFTQFMELLDEAWTERFGLNTTRQHDRLDALYGYDSMWLAALAMDMSEARLQNLTPSLTLGDFKYTGENSTIIKNAIYRSGLEVSFTGASVSNDLHKLTLYENHMPYAPIHVSSNSVFLHTTGPHQAPPQWGQSSRAEIFSVSA